MLEIIVNKFKEINKIKLSSNLFIIPRYISNIC